MDAYQIFAQNILSDRRGRSELARDRRIAAFYEQYPDLKSIDIDIRITTAELLLAMADDPEKGRDRSSLSVLKEKRKEYLKHQNIPMDFDQIIPVCKKCGDTGYVDHRICVCLRELMIPKLFAASGLMNYPNISFAAHKGDLFLHPERMDQLRDISAAFAKAIPEKPGNLLFWGNPGTGKTFMAVCIAREVVMRGISATIVRVSELLEIMSEYRTQMNSFSPDQDRLRDLTQRRDLILTGELLIIDEFGVEPKTSNMISDLLHVLGTRKQRGLSTVITTNLSPANIQNTYDNRLYSRIFGDFDTFRFEGTDQRTKRRI